MPLSSWRPCLRSDSVSVIKCDGLSFLTETLKVSFPLACRLHIRSTLDLSIRHVWIAGLLTAACCGDAVDKRRRGRLLNLTLVEKKPKSWKQLDMTEASPWLWWVTTGAKEQWAAVAPPQKQQVRVWGMSWGGIILIRHNDSSGGLDLSPSFFPAITHPGRAATEPH